MCVSVPHRFWRAKEAHDIRKVAVCDSLEGEKPLPAIGTSGPTLSKMSTRQLPPKPVKLPRNDTDIEVGIIKGNLERQMDTVTVPGLTCPRVRRQPCSSRPASGSRLS